MKDIFSLTLSSEQTSLQVVVATLQHCLWSTPMYFNTA